MADAIFGMPSAPWNDCRFRMQTALALFENRGVVEQRIEDRRHIIKSKLE